MIAVTLNAFMGSTFLFYYTVVRRMISKLHVCYNYRIYLNCFRLPNKHHHFLIGRCGPPNTLDNTIISLGQNNMILTLAPSSSFSLSTSVVNFDTL